MLIGMIDKWHSSAIGIENIYGINVNGANVYLQTSNFWKYNFGKDRFLQISIY